MVLALAAYASVRDLPTKTVDGRTYYYYDVKVGETVYSISKALGMSQNDLRRYNPKLIEGLKAGQTLLFPVEDFGGETVANVTGSQRQLTTERVTLHQVSRGETLYSIARQYGVSVDNLRAWNPQVIDGLKAGQTLRIRPTNGSASSTPIMRTPEPAQAAVESKTAQVVAQVESEPQPIAQSVKQHLDEVPDGSYRIHEGETLFSIARTYSTTVSEILAANPGLSAEGYEAGTVIVIPGKPANDAPSAFSTLSTTESRPSKIITYKVAGNETFYSIARTHGITPQQLEKYNPGLSYIEKGMTIYVPVYDDMESDDSDEADTENPTPDESTAVEAVDDAAVTGNVDSDEVLAVDSVPAQPVSIALVLPFRLDAERADAEATRMLEFYRGFLLAVDSLKDYENPITIKVFDSQGSADAVSSLIRSGALSGSQVIIAPDDASSLALLSDYARSNDAVVLNTFVVADTTWQTNPSMLQANIPHSEMYARAIDRWMQKFAQYKPVFLVNPQAAADKAPFLQMLRSRMESQGVEYTDIIYNNLLSEDNLAVLPSDGRYAFIAASGRQPEANRILPALIRFKTNLPYGSDIVVMGYPDWITFRGETLDNMHTVGTEIYSRFFAAPAPSRRVDRLEALYLQHYGTNMEQGIPRQALLGFDTAMFLISSLSQGTPALATAAYDGVQTDYITVRQPEGGIFNDSLFLIQYNNDRSVKRSRM